jgi:hypothetical protein
MVCDTRVALEILEHSVTSFRTLPTLYTTVPPCQTKVRMCDLILFAMFYKYQFFLNWNSQNNMHGTYYKS